ncbi:unnamed protein product [Heterobilharzia americana]|nr:unnamed protein product [Heterobilharzia americana]
MSNLLILLARIIFVTFWSHSKNWCLLTEYYFGKITCLTMSRMNHSQQVEIPTRLSVKQNQSIAHHVQTCFCDFDGVVFSEMYGLIVNLSLSFWITSSAQTSEKFLFFLDWR